MPYLTQSANTGTRYLTRLTVGLLQVNVCGFAADLCVRDRLMYMKNEYSTQTDESRLHPAARFEGISADEHGVDSVLGSSGRNWAIGLGVCRTVAAQGDKHTVHRQEVPVSAVGTAGSRSASGAHRVQAKGQHLAKERPRTRSNTAAGYAARSGGASIWVGRRVGESRGSGGKSSARVKNRC